MKDTKPSIVFCHGIWADGSCFSQVIPALQDLSEPDKKLVWATQTVPAPDLFEAKVAGTAWKSKPSWYIVAKNDRTIQPDCERFLAKRMGATTTEVGSSHVVMLSQPQVVIDVIRKNGKSCSGSDGSSLKSAKPPPFFGGAAAQSRPLSSIVDK